MAGVDVMRCEETGRGVRCEETGRGMRCEDTGVKRYEEAGGGVRRYEEV